jgi:hypothetical protein
MPQDMLDFEKVSAPSPAFKGEFIYRFDERIVIVAGSSIRFYSGPNGITCEVLPSESRVSESFWNMDLVDPFIIEVIRNMTLRTRDDGRDHEYRKSEIAWVVHTIWKKGQVSWGDVCQMSGEFPETDEKAFLAIFSLLKTHASRLRLEVDFSAGYGKRSVLRYVQPCAAVVADELVAS